MAKKPLTEQTIQTYLEYLVSIKLCYGTAVCKEKFSRCLQAAALTYSTLDVKKLRAELTKRLPIEHNKQLQNSCWKEHNIYET